MNKNMVTTTNIIEREAMANCVQLLFQKKINQSSKLSADNSSPSTFRCKICHRKFPSFHALGGHCASHKYKHKHRQLHQDHEHDQYPNNIDSRSRPVPRATHQCSICGDEFPIGQALGGHMRRHKSIISTSSHHRDRRRRHHSSTNNNVDQEDSSEASASTTFLLKLLPPAGPPSPPSTPPPTPPRRPRPVDHNDDHHEIEPVSSKKFKQLADDTFMGMGLNLCLGRSGHGHDDEITKLVPAEDIHDFLQLRLEPPVIC